MANCVLSLEDNKSTKRPTPAKPTLESKDGKLQIGHQLLLIQTKIIKKYEYDMDLHFMLGNVILLYMSMSLCVMNMTFI